MSNRLQGSHLHDNRAKTTTKRNKTTHIEGATDCRATTSITIDQKQQQNEIKLLILRKQQTAGQPPPLQ